MRKFVLSMVSLFMAALVIMSGVTAFAGNGETVLQGSKTDTLFANEWVRCRVRESGDESAKFYEVVVQNHNGNAKNYIQLRNAKDKSVWNDSVANNGKRIFAIKAEVEYLAIKTSQGTATVTITEVTAEDYSDYTKIPPKDTTPAQTQEEQTPSSGFYFPYIFRMPNRLPNTDRRPNPGTPGAPGGGPGVGPGGGTPGRPGGRPGSP